MVWRLPFSEENYAPMSGVFRYSDGQGGTLTFSWDGAARAADGSIVLIEAETAAPVVLHVQGHVARAAFMCKMRTPVSRIVWIVPERYFDALWGIIEPWRAALAQAGLTAPPSEYRTPTGRALAVSMS